ncbi:MAG: hypothetical protein ACOVQE_03670 [Chitinophagaceae bacterium]
MSSASAPSVISFICKNPVLQRWLLVMLLVQVLFSYRSIGFFHPDQHFQIIEFALHQLKEPNGTAPIWELEKMIRPSVQVHLFSAFYIVCNSIGIDNPFTQIGILHCLMGLSMFVLFSAILIWYLQKKSLPVLLISLGLLNLTWSFPYIRSLFSSEILGSFLFFATAFAYERMNAKKQSIPLLTLIIIGFCFALAFYVRFQMAFALVGWFLALLIRKKWAEIPSLGIGFLVGIALNVYLDQLFYHQWVFTPYKYFYVNIFEGVAASFGTSSFLTYIGILAGILAAPLLSIFLFGVSCYSFLKNWKHPLVLSTFVFIVGHCFIGHKEERFLYPIFFILPLFIGWQLVPLQQWYNSIKGIKKLAFQIFMYLGIGLNFFLLVLFSFINYAQTVSFAHELNKNYTNAVTIHCFERTPLETESQLPLVYYQKGIKNVNFKELSGVKALDSLQQKPQLIATTFNDIREHKQYLQQLGYQETLYSSTVLWRINEWLASKNINTINDIWVLYRYQKN